MSIRKIGTVSKAKVEVKIYYVSEYEEFQVKLVVNGIVNQDANYYTSDKADAVSTAIDMLDRECRIQELMIKDKATSDILPSWFKS